MNRTFAQDEITRPGATKSELINEENDQWKDYRTKERPILRRAGLNRYIDVRISRNDCVLISRPEIKISNTEISDWYECLQCGSIHEITASKGKLTECPDCRGAVILIGEPFQATQFSRDIGNGAERRVYADAKPLQRAYHCEELNLVLNLYLDPNSRIQRGGTGYLRVSLDEARSTRGIAPEWLPRRERYLQTLRKSRSERAERILHAFFIEKRTDDQIAECEGWTKDAIKKERRVLIERGNHFFQLGKIPP